jgi:hypothetical protein
MPKAKSSTLDVRKVMREFEKQEAEGPHRKDALKIDKPFEEALDIILKAKPEPKKSKIKN